MRRSIITNDLRKIKPEGIILWVFEDQDNTEELEAYTGSMLQKIIQRKAFTGKGKETYVLQTDQDVGTVVLVGLGKRTELTCDMLRNAAACAAKQMKKLKIKSFAVTLVEELDLRKKVHAIVEGIELALYDFNMFKTPEKDQGQIEAYYIKCNASEEAQVDEALASAVIVTHAIYKCRDLQNLPSSIATPQMLAAEAQKMAKEVGMKCTVWGNKELEAAGMGGILAVNKGSPHPVQLVILEWKGGSKKVCLVGKGITFDSGGISIKPAQAMDEMKFDMSGGAVVLSTMYAAAKLHIPLHLIGIIPFTENMPGGSAYKPGDILRMYNKKTVEVLDTDAEGRLILADALALAAEYKPSMILDYATLTGACVVALGNVCSGFFTNDMELRDQIMEASRRTGEKTWELPLLPEYKEDIKSKVADLKNIGRPREAGATAAAVFLQEFVNGTKWAHLDIAGTAWTTQEQPLCTHGGTGYGIRLTLSLLYNLTE